MKSKRTPFNNWDNDSDAGKGADYLEGLAAVSSVMDYKRRNMEAMHLQAGYHVLDVGCGLGDDLCLIAPLVGETGRLVGLDHNPNLLQRAQEQAAEANLTIEFQAGAIENMPFEDNSFDAVRSSRVFQHLPDPIQALHECIRVLKPAGRLAISEPDWETFMVDSSYQDIWSRVLPLSVSEQHVNGRIGRQLYSLFAEMGLEDAQVSGDVITFTDYRVMRDLAEVDMKIDFGVQKGLITAEEANHFHADLEARAQKNTYFAALTVFTISGVKRA